MIGFINGCVDFVAKNFIIVECKDIGYEIKFFDTHKIFVGQAVKIYTRLMIKDDRVILYGFISYDELIVFDKLIGISGIGPKAVQNILAAMRPSEICFAIANQNLDAFNKISGIGKKTAQRLILELKDKFDIVFSDDHPAYNKNMSDAIDALCELNYKRDDIINAIKNLVPSLDINSSPQEIIKRTLKNL